MLNLITFPATFGEPSSSPFCVKAMILLQMSGKKNGSAKILATRPGCPMASCPVYAMAPR